MKLPAPQAISRRGFTLVEMLVVLMVIVLLMGLVMSGVVRARRQGELNRARIEMQSLVVALQNYQADYAVWPWMPSAENAYPTSAGLTRLLSGIDEDGGTPALQGNPKRRVYLSFKANQTNSTGALVDPWGKPYQVVFDANGDGLTPSPFGAGISSNRVVCFIWSHGPNGTSDANGVMSENNKDNLLSY